MNDRGKDRKEKDVKRQKKEPGHVIRQKSLVAVEAAVIVIALFLVWARYTGNLEMIKGWLAGDDVAVRNAGQDLDGNQEEVSAEKWLRHTVRLVTRAVEEGEQRIEQQEEEERLRGLEAEKARELELEQQRREEEAATQETVLKEAAEPARRLAAGYDYDGAVAFLEELEEYPDSEYLQQLAAEFVQEREELVPYQKMDEITHIFFHSLIMDADKAFDGDEKEAGYNQVMTTQQEFEAIMQQMYEKGYVLVSLKDIAEFKTDKDGDGKFQFRELMLPKGKIPFVLSVDDVSYYEYMEGDGFASRIVLDDNGKPVCEMEVEDGSTVRGDFDVVPCLETFIEEHPDFSYRGARGILALTGYNGVLGYRTGPEYAGREDYDEQAEQAKETAAGLKKWGWEFASHSYGHINYGTVSVDKMKYDANLWQESVAPIIGDTDILIYPFGADICDWQGYSGERFEFLFNMGFRYFCNVDSAPYWIQMGTNYFRQGRRNLDGVRMYYDMIDERQDFLSDLFDVEEVFDKRRPVPVPPM